MKKAVRVRDGFQGSQEGPGFTSSMNKTVGMVSTEYETGTKWYRVIFDFGSYSDYWNYMEEWLEFGLVDDNGNFTAKEPKPKENKGYRVREMDSCNIDERRCLWNPRMNKTMGKESFNFTEDPSDNTVKLIFDDGEVWWYDAEWLEEITFGDKKVEEDKLEKQSQYQRTAKIVIGPPSRLIKLLEDQGYEFKAGGWHKKGKLFFNPMMLEYVGKKPGDGFNWENEWLEEKYTSQAIIDEIMTIKKKIVGDAYYSEDDRDTIYGWSDEDAKKVLDDMVYTLTKSTSNDDILLRGFCPFCRFHKSNCSECSYADNHGKCTSHDSDYRRLMKKLVSKRETGSNILNVIYSNPITKHLGGKGE